LRGEAKILSDFKDRHTLFDSMILFRFFRDLYPWEKLSLMINATTGMELDKAQLQRMALKITNQAREFNLREGMSSDDDTLPIRFFEEKLGDSGRVFSKKDFEKDEDGLLQTQRVGFKTPKYKH